MVVTATPEFPQGPDSLFALDFTLGQRVYSLCTLRLRRIAQDYHSPAALGFPELARFFNPDFSGKLPRLTPRSNQQSDFFPADLSL